MDLTIVAVYFYLLSRWAAFEAVSASNIVKKHNGVVIEEVVKEGGPMRLRCPPRRDLLSSTSVHWYYNGRLIVSRPAGGPSVEPIYYIEEFEPNMIKHRLKWREVIYANAGLYSCKMESHADASSARWRNYSVTVELAPVFDPYSRPPSESQVVSENKSAVAPKFIYPIPYLRLVMIGDDVTLQCHAIGVPTPVVTWYRDGLDEPLTSSDFNNDGVNDIDISAHMLKFTAVRQYDAGRYTCIVSNEYGSINHTFEVQTRAEVHTKPLIVSRPANVSATQGASVRFLCTAKSTLHFHTKWLYSGTGPLTDQDVAGSPHRLPELKGDRYIFRNSRSVLNITNVTQEDAGYYSCVAFNDFGFDTASAYLSVVEERAANLLAVSTTSSSFPVVTTASILLVLLAIAIVAGCWRVRRERREKLRAVRRAETMRVITKRIIVEHRKQKQQSHVQEKMEEQRAPLLAPLVRIERSECKSKPYSATTDCDHAQSEYEMPRDSCWELSRQLIRLGGQLGEGAFGRVLYGELMTSESDPEQPRPVAVKMLKEGHTDSDLIDLVSELEVMKLIGHHLNIVSLIGACTQGGPLMVVVEYAQHGNLRSYLRERRPLANYERAFTLQTLSIRDLACFAYQVARGMQYLASMKCVHRDLAARNVLVGENLTVKIADFGMARDVRDTDYYRKVTDGRLPVKWMAPEALFERVYTSQSDVWSFGILLWEIMSMGGAPYPSVPSVTSLFTLLRSGHRMDSPPGCPSSLYDLMLGCWQYHPHNRPTFSSLVDSIGTIMTHLSPMEYLDLALPSTDEAADDHPARSMTPDPTSAKLQGSVSVTALQSMVNDSDMADTLSADTRFISKSAGDLC